MPDLTELGTEITETDTSGVIPGVTDGGTGTTSDGSLGDQTGEVDTTTGLEDQPITLDLEDRDAEPFVTDAMPNELKALLSNQQVAPHIQRLWDRLGSFQSIFSTPREAREFRDMFPGGLEDARTISAKASELDQSNELLYSGDANSQLQVLQPMFDDNPDAFMSITKTSLDMVAQRNPQLYNQFAGELVNKQLQGDKFGNHLEWMYGTLQKLNSTDPKEKEAAITELANQTATLVKWAQSKGYVGKERDLGRTETRTDPKITQLQKENESLRKNQWASFANSVNSGARPQIESSIKKLIEPAMKAVPDKQRVATTNLLVKQIRIELETRLQSDQLYQNQYKAWLDSKTIPNVDQAVKFLVGRAQAHVRAVAKQIMTPWSTSYVADKNATGQKITETGTRVDVTGGGNTGGRTTKSKLTQTEANAMDPKDILGWSRTQYEKRNAAR